MEKIYELIVQQNFSLYIVFTLFLGVFIIKKFVSNFEYFHHYWVMREQNKINDLLEKQNAVSNAELRKLVQETIDEYAFRKCTGISVNQYLRKAILDCHFEYKIELFHFKRAVRFIEYNDNKISIKISFLDKIGKYFNIIFSIILFLFPILPYLFLNFADELSWQRLLIFPILAIGSILFGAYVLTQNFPLQSAYLIKEKLPK